MQRLALNSPRAVTMSDRLNLAALLFAAASAGYPIAGLMAELFGVSSRMTAIPFRLLVLLLAVAVSFRGIWSVRFRPGVLLVLLFWGFYAIRLYFDLAVVGLAGADYAFGFFVMACVAPSLALLASDTTLDNVALARATLWVGGIGCGALAVYYVLGGLDATKLIRRFSIETVNPITIGYLGSACITAAVYLWSKARHLSQRFGLSIAIGLSVACMVLAASKGPVVALVACLVFWALKRRKYSQVMVVACVLAFFAAYLAGTSLGTRFLGVGKDPSTIDRYILLRDSYAQITRSPILGSAYVELNSGTYPHNIFVEAALAVGVPLALMLAALTAVAVVRAWNAIGNGGTLVSLFFIQALVNSVTSGSLFAITSFWVTTLVLLNHRRWAAIPDSTERFVDWLRKRRAVFSLGRYAGSARLTK